MANNGQESQQNSTETLPKALPINFLKQITSDFSSEVGRSSFGRIYKGTLANGDVIAVKKLENSPLPNEKTFGAEVTNLMALQHENIVKLRGFCHDTQKDVVQHSGRFVIVDMVECYLCYQYLPVVGIDKYITAETSTIDWDKRFKIIKGVCNGLHYLHEEKGDGPLIHMNLLPQTIWLDDNWVPKIADFGLSRLFGKDQTRINTMNVVGQNGYMAPEYLYRGEISTKSDIYSLGMLILELTTGEKNCGNENDRSAREFVEKVREHWRTDDHIMSKYPLLETIGLQQVKECIAIALKCVEVERIKRPSIADIVNRLNRKRVPFFEQESANNE